MERTLGCALRFVGVVWSFALGWEGINGSLIMFGSSTFPIPSFEEDRPSSQSDISSIDDPSLSRPLPPIDVYGPRRCLVFTAYTAHPTSPTFPGPLKWIHPMSHG